VWPALVILFASGVPVPPAGGVEVNPPLATGTLVISGRVRVTVEVARSSVEQIRGLSGRPDLKPSHGMLFVYDRPQPVSIWMKDMRFPLDILWIRGGRIVKIEKRAPPLDPHGPERIYTATADQVLEVPAGFSDRERIHLGDTVRTTLP
jgi:uncharacterized membrane protein (UPF0127 family)